jgi:RNA polymerase sigma-70 factor (ECF subfamily)
MKVPKRAAAIAGPRLNRDGGSAVTTLYEEEALIDRARRGERSAFGELYDRYADAIYRYVAFRVRDDDAAEDVTSDVFIKAMVALPRYESRQAFLAWLYRIARNAVIDRSRLASRRVETALTEPMAAGLVANDAAADPESHVVASERRERLRLALAELSADQQDVIALRFVAGLSAEEVAVVLRKPASTVRGIQMRGLRALRRSVSADELR